MMLVKKPLKKYMMCKYLIGKYLVNDVGKSPHSRKNTGRPCALLAALSQLRAALAQQSRGLADEIDEKWRDVHGFYNNQWINGSMDQWIGFVWENHGKSTVYKIDFDHGGKPENFPQTPLKQGKQSNESY